MTLGDQAAVRCSVEIRLAPIPSGVKFDCRSLCLTSVEERFAPSSGACGGIESLHTTIRKQAQAN
jgi:hypothetical protein